MINRFQIRCKVLNLLVLLIGIWVLLGWMFDIEFLKQPLPSTVAMNPATASAFIFSSIALYYIAKGNSNKSIAGNVFAIIVLMIGSIKILGLIVGFDPQIDHILFSSKVNLEVTGGQLNRMAPNTAFCFILTGVALLLMGSKKIMSAHFFTIIIILCALLSLLGYSYQVKGLSNIFTYIPMAIHTAFGFLSFSIALLYTNPDNGLMKVFTSPYEGSTSARKFLPVAIAVPIMLGFLRIYTTENGLIPHELGTALFILSIIIIFIIYIYNNAEALNKKDIKRKEVENTLLESQQLLQSIIDNTSSFISVKDLKGRYMMVNDTYSKIFSTSKKELLGKTDFDLTDYEAALKLKQQDEEILRENKMLETELRASVMGEPRDFISIRFPLKNAEGKVYGTGGVFTDITEIKKQSDLIHDLYDNAPAGYYSIDTNGKFINANYTTLSWLGYEKQELIGKPITEILDSESIDAFKKSFPVFKEKGIINDLELCYKRKDGSVFPVLINASAVKNEQGDFLYSRSTIFDITERKKAEVRETELRKEVELLLTSTGEGLYGIDLDRNCTFINKAGAALLGYQPEECIGKNMHQLVHYKKPNGDIYPELECPIARSTSNRQSCVIDNEVFWKADGSSFNVHYSSYPIIDNGKLKGSVVTFSDITERKKLEDQLKEYQHFFNHNNDLCGIANKDGYFESINTTFSKTIGYSKNEFCNIPFIELIHPDDVASTLKIYDQLKSGAMVVNFINRYRKKDGNYLRLDWNATPDPVTGKLYCVARDITERKKLEDALINSNEKFLKLFYSSPLAMLIRNIEDGKVLDVNEEYERLTGYTKEEMVGTTTIGSGILLNHDSGDEVKKMVTEKKSLKNVEATIYNKINEPINVIVSMERIRLDNKECILSAILDITERKKLEDNLTIINKEMESFTYSVSHDLRSPLRIVNGYAEIIKEDANSKLSDETRRMLDNIVINAKRMGNLIDDLLNFSRLGRRDLHAHDTDVNSIVHSIMQQQLIEKENYHIKIDNLPICFCDSSLIKQVWENLISNAIKYSAKKVQPAIEIGAVKQKNETVYYIKDNGAGFNMKYYDKLFGVFQRLHKPSEFEGIGVGLALAQRIILKHGGKIWAESKLNEGTTFYFTLNKL